MFALFLMMEGVHPRSITGIEIVAGILNKMAN
jgi:hypothetical protein